MYYPQKITKNNGFTLIEILVVLTISALLLTFASTSFRDFQNKQSLNNEAEKLVSVLFVAQSKTVSSRDLSQWGVYFNMPQSYTLFNGADYATRNPALDKIYTIENDVTMSSVNLAEGVSQIVFKKLSGFTDQAGTIVFELTLDSSKSKTVHINSAGQISFSSFPALSEEDRDKDARHVHVDYSSFIDTATSTSDSLVLSFDGGTVEETIVISENLLGGQLYWEGEIDVDGETQTLVVQTQRINDSDTQFCIYRSNQYNNKSLDIDIGSDSGSTPNLISFSADGLTTATGSSIFVSGMEWQ
ncbi:MAG: prepilin-type N-terminal cleavage/methylation domain-containing protein [bacterium]